MSRSVRRPVSQSVRRMMSEDFVLGYRHMCRWWGVLFADLLLGMGYEYAARLDDDSRLLSRLGADMFEQMAAGESCNRRSQGSTLPAPHPRPAPPRLLAPPRPASPRLLAPPCLASPRPCGDM